MTEEVRDIPVYQITPDPNQPRKHFDPDSLQELADSITENGVILPIIVSPVGNDKYQIIAGERRWRASILAKKATIPCIVRELEPFTRQMQALLENVQRNDLNPLEEANAYQQLMDEYDMSHEQIAQSVGKSRATITNSLRLLKLPSFVQDQLADGLLSAGHAKVILSLTRESDMLYLAGKIIQDQLSVRDASAIAEKLRKQKSSDPPVATVDNEIANSLQQLQLQLQRVEDQLCRYFGTQVKLKTNKDQSGSVEISFNDLAELERILELLGYND